MKIRILAVRVKNNFYVADTAELEHLLGKGFKIESSCMSGDIIFYTLVMH